MKRLFVLENKKGEVVRQIHLEASEAELVILTGSKRVEMVCDFADLDKEEIKYTKIARISSDMKQQKIAIGDLGFLRLSSEEDKVSLNIVLPQDDESQIKESLKWTMINC